MAPCRHISYSDQWPPEVQEQGSQWLSLWCRDAGPLAQAQNATATNVYDALVANNYTGMAALIDSLGQRAQFQNPALAVSIRTQSFTAPSLQSVAHLIGSSAQRHSKPGITRSCVCSLSCRSLSLPPPTIPVSSQHATRHHRPRMRAATPPARISGSRQQAVAHSTLSTSSAVTQST